MAHLRKHKMLNLHEGPLFCNHENFFLLNALKKNMTTTICVLIVKEEHKSNFLLQQTFARMFFIFYNITLTSYWNFNGRIIIGNILLSHGNLRKSLHNQS